jgi:hypothetical protein
MKRCPIFLAFTLLATPAFAQVGTMKWHFNSRDDVVPALQKTRGNLRSTYDVIMCAVRSGYSNSCVGYYENVVNGHEFNATAQDSAAYAFAFDVSYGMRPWGWEKDTDSSMVTRSGRATALYFRDRAYSALPNSPEVLIMRSFWASTQERPLRREGYTLGLKAIKIAPKWADAYFWLNGSIGSYYNQFRSEMLRPEVTANAKKMQEDKAIIIRLAKFDLRVCDRAEKLDPAIHPWLLLDRAYAYQLIPEKKSAQMIPILIDAHLKAFPEWAVYNQKQWGVSEREYRAGWRTTAARIAKEANS